MRPRTILLLILCVGLVGCGGSVPSAAPTGVATIVMASPANTSAPSQPAAAVMPGTPRQTPRPSPTPKPLAVPPAPSRATFKITYPSETTNKMTVTWTGPRSKGIEIRVYGVTACIAMPRSPSEGSDGPCLVEHTPLPDWVRKLIAKAPASNGKVSWTWPNWEDIGSSVAMSPDGTAYEAIVIAAYNKAGHSKFIIVNAGSWCGGCVY
jgi:hypothetical protein